MTNIGQSSNLILNCMKKVNQNIMANSNKLSFLIPILITNGVLYNVLGSSPCALNY